MSYLRKAKATCGRYARKPNETDESLNYEDDSSIPLQDLIDNLRAKMSLKEKYNKALSEEVAESNSGATEMIAELTEQTKQLREELMLEKNAEKYAIKKALRTHRLFYLPMADNDALTVINWLDDKIFDAAKTLNETIHYLTRIQSKLQNAEMQVYYLEQCPVPGTELWERRAEKDRVTLECAIENRIANKDAALILNKKYHHILHVLKNEQAKWPRFMLSMELTMKQLRAELLSLEVMLDDALKFREEAREKLELIEQEAQYNRQIRKTQKIRMKKVVEKALASNLARYASHDVKKKSRLKTMSSVLTPSQSIFQEIRAKQLQLEEYENTVNKLVEAMRVPDLRECPKRLFTVRKVMEALTKEIKGKEELRELLLKHKYRLQLILYYFRYTGAQKETEFQEKLAEKQLAVEEEESELEIRKYEMNKDGNRIRELRFAMIGLDEVLNQGRKRQRSEGEGLTSTMKRLLERVKELVKSLETLQKLFPEGKRPRLSYQNYVKYTTNPRHVRVGAPDENDIDEDSDHDIDIDSKIPSRQELKIKSERFYRQALLQRGLR